jgi:hypothetical protein
MHAVTLSLSLLALFAGSPAEPEEAVAEAPAAVEMPAYFELRVEAGKAFVTVPLEGDEGDAWSAATSGEKRFPARLDALRPTSFVMPGGSITPGAFVGYETSGGASDMWWVIEFEAKGARDGAGLAILGDVDSPQLRKPGRVALSSATGQEQLVAIRAMLDSKLSAADRKRLGKKVLSKTRVQMIEGSFPNDATMLVSIDVPMKVEPGMSISALFTMTSDGEVATMLHAPKMRLEHFEPQSLGDIDADGLDDVVFESAYYEGRYKHLLRWSDAGPGVTTIAGDGA